MFMRIFAHFQRVSGPLGKLTLLRLILFEWRKHLALTNPQKIKDIQAKMAADKEFQKSELAEILSKPSLSEMQLSGEEFTMSFIF